MVSLFPTGHLLQYFEYLLQVDPHPFLFFSSLKHSCGPWFQTGILKTPRWFVSSCFSLPLSLFSLFSHHILSSYIFISDPCAASAMICVEKPTYLLWQSCYDNVHFVNLCYHSNWVMQRCNVTLFDTVPWYAHRKLGKRGLCRAAMELGLKKLDNHTYRVCVKGLCQNGCTT